MLVHSGTSAQDIGRHVPLQALSPEMIDAYVPGPEVAALRAGMILEREGEQVLITNVSGQVVRIVRGYGGTTIRRHPTAFWQIQAAPLVIGPGSPPIFLDASAVRADCRTCGAPAQAAGERCRYCAHVVSA